MARRRRWQTIRTAVAVAVLLAGTTACRDDPTESPTPEASGPTSAGAVSRDQPAPDAPPEDLRLLAASAVLGRDDLGDEWQQVEASPLGLVTDGGPARADASPCDRRQQDPLLAPSPVEVAATAWSSSTGAQTVASTAYAYADEVAADIALNAYRDVAHDCTSWGSGGAEGSPFAFAMTQSIFNADVGVDSFATERVAHVAGAGGSAPSSTYVIASRTGAVVQLTAFTAPGRETSGLAVVLTHARAAAALLT